MTDTQKDMENDEISLIDLFAVIWCRKILIIGITVCAMVGSFLYAFIGKKLPPEKSFMPDVYTSTAFMRIRTEDKADTLGMLASGSLVGLIGGGVAGKDSNHQLALYIADSNSFLDAVADEFNITEKYKITSFSTTKSRDIIRSGLKVKMDEKTGIFSIAFTHIDSEFAQQVVLFIVEYYEKRFAEMGLDKKLREKENLEKTLLQTLDEIKRLEQESVDLENKVFRSPSITGIALTIEQIKREIGVQEQIYGQLKTQYELLKVKMASELPLFQVLDMPEIPEKKSGPSRAKFCIIVSAAGFFFSIFLAFLLNAIQNMLADHIVLSKFKRNLNENI